MAQGLEEMQQLMLLHQVLVMMMVALLIVYHLWVKIKIKYITLYNYLRLEIRLHSLDSARSEVTGRDSGYG